MLLRANSQKSWAAPRRSTKQKRDTLRSLKPAWNGLYPVAMIKRKQMSMYNDRN